MTLDTGNIQMRASVRNSKFKFRISKRLHSPLKALVKHWTWPVLLIYSIAVIHYFVHVATDRYVSRTQFVVSRGLEAPGNNALESVLGGGQSKQDAYTAINYLHSIDALRFLEGSGLDLEGHYSHPGRDWLNRLSPAASEHELHHYLKKRILTHFDDVEGIVELEVQAFDPGFALQVAEALVARVGDYLNETNRTIAAERMKFILGELDDSEKRLEHAREKLISFQNANLVIDPVAESQARLALIHELKKQKVQVQAKLIDLRERSPQSPAIAEYISEIGALEQEIGRESGTLTGEGPEQMNQLTSEFAKLNQSLTFASKRYEQSLAVAEEIRVQTVQSHRFLTVVEKPFLPDEATHPRRLYLSISLILAGMLGLQLIQLLVKTALEHR